jgi:hypothetical protein
LPQRGVWRNDAQNYRERIADEPGHDCRRVRLDAAERRRQARLFGREVARQEALDAHAKGPMPGNTYKDWIVGRKVARGVPAD